MALIDKDIFDPLWDINPAYTDPAHDYKNTHVLASNILNGDFYTSKGELVTYDLIFKRYNKHVKIRNQLNDGVDPRYRKKANEVKTLHTWLYEAMYNIEEKIPETNRHFYFWDTLSDKEVGLHFSKFLLLCRR